MVKKSNTAVLLATFMIVGLGYPEAVGAVSNR